MSWDGCEMVLEEETDDGPYMGPFEVDHLATFAVPHQSTGRKLIEDGFDKLFDMERTTGVWTMQCSLLVSSPYFHVVYKENGRESRTQQFSIEDMIEPAARLSDDRRDPFNNVFLFVAKSPVDDKSAEEMHLFQCVNCSAKDIVDGVKHAKSELVKASLKKNRAQWTNEDSSNSKFKYKEQTGGETSSLFAPVTDSLISTSVSTTLRDVGDDTALSGTKPRVDGALREPNEVERVDHDVTMLNKCFDDIESFVARLQRVSEAYKELENRQKKKKSGFHRQSKKDKDAIEQLLSQTLPPQEPEFEKVFKKFKLCFNLLAKLKPHIHNPNSPELVHFLFTPLSLVMEASKNPKTGVPLGSGVVSPLLIKEAVDLLSNCLTSREHHLWMSLGETWYVSKDRWTGYAAPYFPVFDDGWKPNPSIYLDQEDQKMEISSRLSSSVAEVARAQSQRRMKQDESNEQRRERSITDYESAPPRSPHNDRNYSLYESNIHTTGANRGGEPVGSPPSRPPPPESANRVIPPKTESEIENQLSVLVFDELRQDPRLLRAFAQRMQDLEESLLSHGARVYEAVFDRRSNHVKELTVRKSEVVELIDDSKQWWKVRNWRGEEGYVPNTILKVVRDSRASSATPPPPPPPPPPSDSRSSSRLDPSGSIGHAAAVLAAKGQLRSVQAHGAQMSPVGGGGNRSGQDAVNDELKKKMSNGGRTGKPFTDGAKEVPVLYISQESSEEEVQKWLETKGFSPRVRQALQGQTGLSLFTLKQKEFIEFFGKDEGSRLDSQLTVQKNLCGYTTMSSYELRAILNHRKHQVDSTAKSGGDQFLEAPPDFDPPTPKASIDGGSLASEPMG